MSRTSGREEAANPWWFRSVPKSCQWSDLNIERFLWQYARQPLLWDPRHARYRDQKARGLAYEEIAKALTLKNVNGRQLERLVGRLRRRYLQDREFSAVARPPWHRLVDDLVQRVLRSPEKEPAPDNASFEECRECCGAQGLRAPCCFLGQSGPASQKDAFDECLDCCREQGVAGPCCRYDQPSEAEEPPPECRPSPATPESCSCDGKDDSSASEDFAAHCYELPACCASIVMINLPADEANEPSTAASTSSSGSSSSGSSTLGPIDLCDCNDSNLGTPASSTYSKRKLCLHDMSASRPAEPNTADAEEAKKSESASRSTERCPCHVPGRNKTGLFMDSLRFSCSKRVYVADDDTSSCGSTRKYARGVKSILRPVSPQLNL